MISPESLSANLHCWKQYMHTEDDHLDTSALYKLSQPGAIPTASKNQLHHLSKCPKCLEEWANWSKARADVGELKNEREEHVSLAHGFLRAAASSGKEPLSMQSECGRYRLDILPGTNSTQGGLAVLEANFPQEENGSIAVYDCSGQLVIKGTLSEGRVVKPLDDIEKFDFSTWTLVTIPPQIIE